MASVASPRGLKLAVLGAINWDTTVFEQDFASPGEEVPVLRVDEFPGGKGANTAVAASRILGAGGVAFLGALGSDRVKAPLLESLASEGVRTGGVQVIRGSPTGRAFIVVDGKGRKTIHTHFGANDMYGPKHVKSAISSAIISASASVVIMDVPLPAAVAAVELAPKRSRVVFSPGVRVAGKAEDLTALLSRADDLVLDRNELVKLSGQGGAKDGVDQLSRRFVGVTVVATLGPEGCLVAREGRTTQVPPVDLADLGLTPVNSTGSGDAFLGAYACYSLLGATPEEAASWGNVAGALKAASPETRGSPTRKLLEDSMTQLKSIRERRPGAQ